MTLPLPKRRLALRQASWTIVAFILAGCGDGYTVGAPPPLPPVPGSSVLAQLQVDVDARTGEMRFATIPMGAASGVQAQIYGDQNINVRLYNAPPSITTTATLKTLIASVGIRNLRPHPIGDEQGALAPTDTMGIFIFFTSEPVVTATSGACSGACFVRIANHEGSATFDQPNQKYFYWSERLRATGNLLGDTTLMRKPWQFQMSPEVTNFQFFVLVSAAWPAAFETTPRWRVEYRPDSVPELGTEPPWKVIETGSGGTWSITGTPPNTALNLRGRPSSQTFFYRRDSVLTATNAWMEGSLTLTTGNNSPQVGFGFTDGFRVVAIGVGNGRVGFVDYATATYIGSTYSPASGTHAYQLRKYAADSAVLFVDGIRRLRLTYSLFGADPFVGSLSPAIVWGTGFTFSGTNTDWQYVRYEIGSPTP